MKRLLLSSFIAMAMAAPAASVLAETHDSEKKEKPTVEHEKKHKHNHNHDSDEDGREFNIRIGFEDDDEHEHDSGNVRDGFYLGLSAISSFGDDFRDPLHDDGDAEFETDISFRAQIGGFFVESPGLSSRRIHGLYAPSAWGYNFYSDDTWAMDLYYETSVRHIEGLEGIENLHRSKRGGLRATGYFDSSQLQVMFSPYSPDNGDEDGVEASVSYNMEWQVRNVGIYSAVGAHYRSKDVIDNYSHKLDGTEDYSGVSYSAEVGLEYPISTDWVFGGFVRYETLSERTKAARNDGVENGTRAGVLLTYVF
ncbi:MAG: MipA/OmpV family protein [Psychrobium sp.]